VLDWNRGESGVEGGSGRGRICMREIRMGMELKKIRSPEGQEW
jgi:hypothetical protein